MKPVMVEALAQELLFIKTAELLPQEEPYRSQFKSEMWKQFLRNAGAGALGYGAGYGAAELGGMLLDKLMKRPMTEGNLGLLSKGVGALGSIGAMAASAAFNEAQHHIQEARQRDLERERAQELAQMQPSTLHDAHERE